MGVVPRVIPCLLIQRGRLVKTVRFRDPKYVGDPLNAVRIFNEKEVDELIFLDIDASTGNLNPDFDLVREIGAECFMPFAYGGGVHTMDQARRILASGAEKIVFSSAAIETPGLIELAAGEFGSQSVVVSINVKRTLFGRYCVFNSRTRKMLSTTPVQHACSIVQQGAGELLINDVDRDGTRQGYDPDLIRTVASSVEVPVIACGGAGSLGDLKTAIQRGASAAAAGTMFVLYGKHRAVLITYPDRSVLEDLFS
jgi:imidazole glycerol-phosphate synthase subunit HisF